MFASNKDQYWKRKTEMSKRAGDWTRKMENEHAADIGSALFLTKLYDDQVLLMKSMTSDNQGAPGMPKILLEDSDTVSSIMKHSASKGLAALNFASYRNPGGGFLSGSTAQEECLCHESYLYNVLMRRKDYYIFNRKNLNKSLYENRALYTPCTFFRDEREAKCDVITCAAPNWATAFKKGVTVEENEDALCSRIRFVLDIAELKKIKVLILGAFGCGVFGQNPASVATVFKAMLPDYHFDTVVFAIPDKDSNNYKAFENVFANEIA